MNTHKKKKSRPPVQRHAHYNPKDDFECASAIAKVVKDLGYGSERRRRVLRWALDGAELAYPITIWADGKEI